MDKFKKHWRWLRNTVVGKIIGDIVRGFEHDNPMLYGASIAFYMIFSLPALLIFTVFIAGTIFEQQVVEEQIFYYIEQLVGVESARQIGNILKNAALDEARPVAKVIGIATLTFEGKAAEGLAEAYHQPLVLIPTGDQPGCTSAGYHHH